MPRTKKPTPFEIGIYIGEHIGEINWTEDSRTKAVKVRIRFLLPQKIEQFTRCYYYLWEPYSRLPKYLDLTCIEIENERTFVYELVEAVQLEKWPPNG